MTTEQLRAGRELDALVAEKVMGWTRRDGSDRWWDGEKELDRLHSIEGGGGDYYQPDEAWSPSTDIAAAWPVWLKMVEAEPYGWAIFSQGGDDVTVEYFSEEYHGSREESTGSPLDSGPAPLAICQAALRWAEEEKP